MDRAGSHFEMVWLDETPSTNSWLSSEVASRKRGELSDLTAVAARCQSSGRGQRGNSWESEPGKNLTLSVLHYPSERIAPADQFAISEATALAVADTLALFGIEAKVKWPNDIYAGDRKICGILIENSLTGARIDHSILGVGLNVNQTRFLSDAPNPISISQLTGLYFDLNEVAARLLCNLGKRVALLAKPGGREEVHCDFLRRLWRGDGGLYPFRQRDTGEIFRASIVNVEPGGFLHLSNGRSYAFKEVEFLLSDPV